MQSLSNFESRQIDRIPLVENDNIHQICDENDDIGSLVSPHFGRLIIGRFSIEDQLIICTSIIYPSYYLIGLFWQNNIVQ